MKSYYPDIFRIIKVLFFIVAESSAFIAIHIIIYRMNHNFFQFILLCILIYILLFRLINSNLYNFIITLLVFSIFVFTIPAMNDRSGTVYLMKSIQKNQHISVMDLQNSVAINYLNKSFIQKRLQEQILAGNISEEDGSLKLTKKGHIFTNIYRFFELCYN